MRAVLVFCEGHHDVVFTQRSLGALGNCTWVKKPVTKLPSPFGAGKTTPKGLIARRFERHALEEHGSLQEAVHPPLPSFESVVENAASGTIYFLVRAHGNQVDVILDLLRELDAAITEEVAGTFEVSEYAAAFLVDADGEGLGTTLTTFRRQYSAYFEGLSSVKHGQWVSTSTVPVGCFVFHRSAQEEWGTLEDHLAPMAESAWPGRYPKARNFIDTNMEADDKVSSNDAERLKAIITTIGQFNHPGDPMSVVIGRGGLPPEQFKASPLSGELVEFLMGTPWNTA